MYGIVNLNISRVKIMHRYIYKLNFVVSQTTVLYGIKSIIVSIENYHQGKLSLYHHKLLDHFVEDHSFSPNSRYYTFYDVSAFLLFLLMMLSSYLMRMSVKVVNKIGRELPNHSLRSLMICLY